MAKVGYLVLENGRIFEGISFGKKVDVSGEVVFNTGMVGYPEGLTDPSYFGQILTLTYPLIGNYGIPKKKKTNKIIDGFESDRIQIRGLIVSSYVADFNHWSAKLSLGKWLKKNNVPALSGIDTRSLTSILREKGVMKGVITFKKPRLAGLNFYDINKDNLVLYVSCKNPITYGDGHFRILLIDCGVKLNIIRNLIKRNVKIIRVPWNYNPFEERQRNFFDAIVISNGPGDPKMLGTTVKIIKKAIVRKIPILGICLGNQVLALASGGDTFKLKYGHRGQNQPVKDETTNKCFITSQNHGFSVETKSLPDDWRPWFTNLNDGTNEGIIHKKLPFLSVQFHPEATPGPNDTEWIFDFFLKKVKDDQ